MESEEILELGAPRSLITAFSGTPCRLMLDGGWYYINISTNDIGLGHILQHFFTIQICIRAFTALL